MLWRPDDHGGCGLDGRRGSRLPAFVKAVAVIAAIVWLGCWLLLNSLPEAIINLFVGAGISALYRTGA